VSETLRDRVMREVRRCKAGEPGRLCFCEACNARARESQREAIQWLNRELRKGT